MWFVYLDSKLLNLKCKKMTFTPATNAQCIFFHGVLGMQPS